MDVFIKSTSGVTYVSIENEGVMWSPRPVTAGAVTNIIVEGTPIHTTMEIWACTAAGARYTAADGDAIYVKNINVYKIGATLAFEPEGIQPSPGQWLDSSTNKLHALQPVAGASLTRKQDRFEIRGVNTWAATHEPQSMTQATDASRAILPPNCYIDEIIGVIAGTTIEDIIIGDGSDTNHWVEITTGLAAGTVAFAIANRISDGTNFEMVIDPDGNFTGSITWCVRGHILS